MSIKSSKRLVIDADVARAAGGKDAIYPTPKHCRDFLEAVRVICYRVVMTDEIKREWAEHLSSFTRTWLYKMYGARKVEFVDDVLNNDLRRKIRNAASCEKDCLVMIKDVHLLEAAQVTDNSIISKDETVRVLFFEASSKVGEIKSILWINPDYNDKEVMRWLEDGADLRKEWMLCQDKGR
jgi:hypothetical protein